MFEIGTSLREARERQRIDLVEAESATKVRAKYLRALEDEQFELLPGHTYVKGFLRTYADYLGLDGQLYVDEYNSRYVAEEEPPLRTRGRPQQNAPPRVGSRALVLALGAIVLVTALVIAAFKFAGDNGKNDASAFNPPPPPPSHKVVAKKHHAEPKPVKQRSATPVVAHVSLTARWGPSWIRVHNGSAAGRELFSGTIATGQSRVFAERRLYVEMGRPWNLVVLVNGHRRSLPKGFEPKTVVVTSTQLKPAA